MAMTMNREKALYLAPNFQPDIDEILTKNGLAAFGIPGSGKSNFLLLLVKQYVRYLLPLVLFDTEGEYTESLRGVLPNGLFIDKSNCDLLSAYDILSKGQQVVIDLSSWIHTDEDEDENEEKELRTILANGEAASVITHLIDTLFTTQAGYRTPCAILMDEAAYWLPRRNKAIAYLEKRTRANLLSTFEKLGSRGRKYGLVPHYFTQYVSQIDLDCVKGCGHFCLMQARFPNDLSRYSEFVDLSKEQIETIRRFRPGEALVLGPQEDVWTRFYADETHTSVTPSAQDAIVKFSKTLVNKQQPPADEQTYTMLQACDLLKVSRATFYIYLKVAQVEPCNPGHKPSLFRASDIDKCKAAMSSGV